MSLRLSRPKNARGRVLFRAAFVMLGFAATCDSRAQDTFQERVVYGEDNRIDLINSTSTVYRHIAQGTALLIPKSDIRAVPENSLQRRLPSMPLQNALQLCADQRFGEQPTAGFCSGFLVGPSTLVTAGHCIETTQDCSQTAVVFGYQLHGEGLSASLVAASDVYRCKSIIKRVSDALTGADFAMIKLDKAVAYRQPLTIRRTGHMKDTTVAAAGHPSGLPLKVATRGVVRSRNSDFYFTSNLDGMSSGSPVFSPATGIVEGVMVRGEADFVESPEGGCWIHKICKETFCRGEDATLTSVFADLIPSP